MSRTLIRKDTDSFLSNSQRSISFSGVPLSFENPAYKKAAEVVDLLKSLNPVGGALINGERATTDYLELSGSQTALTGAIDAELPMHISMVGKDGYRMELVLLINPENMNHGKTNSTQAAYTRNGYVVQPWGSNLDTISCQGKSAGFMVAGQGMTNDNRVYSFGYSNFMGLVNAYKNNGYTLLDLSASKIDEVTRLALLIHGVEIYYDGTLMMGHFSNFTLDESADQPFLLSYNFEFVVSTLDGDNTEIRGHYMPIPDKGVNIGVPQLLEDAKNFKITRAADNMLTGEVPVDPFYSNIISADIEAKAKGDPNAVYAKYQGYIWEAAQTYGVDPTLITGIITQESRGRSDAESPVGALGLMQIMPDTGRELGVMDSKNLMDPKTNIMAGTKYIAQLLNRYGGNQTVALAAYNAGMGNVDKAGKGVPPFAETIDYVQLVDVYKNRTIIEASANPLLRRR